MGITQRRYKALVDFPQVHRFLTETYDPASLNSYLLPQYFEYGHTHRSFNHHITHHIGLWEDNGEIVGIACYGMYPGEYPGRCHLHVRKGYESLLPETLEWAKENLCEANEGQRQLACWITDKEPQKRELLQKDGFVLDMTKPVKIFDYTHKFLKHSLPAGFNIIDGTSVDYRKLNSCFWWGFEGKDDPDNNFDCRIHMWNAPNARLDLNTIIVAPDGEYACALGMWYDPQNQYAYLEPLATIPKYKGMKLATIALSEAMKKTKTLGAQYCFGAASEFYSAIGFETVCNRELWRKQNF